ncbi:MAG: hypothetical protein JRJ24_15895, partial [Deltaproteobacteria bacterium]|nr:hypothetical protein [Deltaproteobacteria bacterium]
MRVLGLVLILGLAAWGCDSSSNGGAGAGGTGGTAGSGGGGGAVGDACLGADDQNFVCNNDVKTALTACTFCDLLMLGCPDDCTGTPVAVGTPAADCADVTIGPSCDPGLTADCLDCFLETTQCGTIMCAASCAGSGTNSSDGCACLDCVAASCDAAFEACAGFSQGIADSGTEGDEVGDGEAGGPPSCEGSTYCKGGREGAGGAGGSGGAGGQPTGACTNTADSTYVCSPAGAGIKGTLTACGICEILSLGCPTLCDDTT